MEDGVIAIGVISVLSIFVFAPWLLFHYITVWRNQKTLKPDDEKIMEDLWRSAKRMERRIEALEALISEGRKAPPAIPQTQTIGETNNAPLI